MKTHISETPEKEAGEYINTKLDEHASEQILLLLSGGSAFSILDHIDPKLIGPHVKIGLTDERFTTDANGNNFLQLQQTKFYKNVIDSGVQFFDSFPKDEKTQSAFSNRIKEDIEKYFYAYPESYALGIFGIGEDGHTAGIFPMSEKEFTDTYRTAEFYIPVIEASNTYPLRSSITPAFIEEVIDDVVLYAVGTTKCENILDYMYNRTFAEHEIPALIPASHPQSVLFTDCPTLIP